MACKGKGKEAKLSYNGNLLVENRGRRQGIRHGGFCGRVQKLKGHAPCGPKPGATRWERH
jgi:hypothetical protein